MDPSTVWEGTSPPKLYPKYFLGYLDPWEYWFYPYIQYIYIYHYMSFTIFYVCIVYIIYHTIWIICANSTRRSAAASTEASDESGFSLVPCPGREAAVVATPLLDLVPWSIYRWIFPWSTIHLLGYLNSRNPPYVVCMYIYVYIYTV